MNSGFPDLRDDPFECIRWYNQLPGGRVSFSNGVVWYTYEDAMFHTDRFHSIRSFDIRGLQSNDTEFLESEWLKDQYPKILVAQGLFDPFYYAWSGRSYYFPYTSRERRSFDQVRATAQIETRNGWHVTFIANALRSCAHEKYCRGTIITICPTPE